MTSESHQLSDPAMVGGYFLESSLTSSLEMCFLTDMLESAADRGKKCLQ